MPTSILRLFFSATLLFLVVGCATATPSEITASAAVMDDDVPAEARNRVYVCNQNDATVSVIDRTTFEIIHTVDLQAYGMTANAKPHHIAVEPDGAHWYVSLIADGKVLKFTHEYELVGVAEFETPGMLAVHPNGKELVVGRSMMAVNPPQRIGLIDVASMEIEELDVFFPRPHAIAIEPSGKYVFTASLAANQFLSMDIEALQVNMNAVEGPIHTFVQFAISPDGQSMVVGGQISGQFFIYDISTPSDVQLIKTLDVGNAPWHPIFTPDGKYVYFGNKNADTITVIDMEQMEVASVIEGEGISQPHGSVVSPDGKYVFISNNNLGSGGMNMGGMNMNADDEHAGHEGMNMEEGEDHSGHAGMNMDEPGPGTVVVVNTETMSIEKVITVGNYPSGIGTSAR